MAENSKIEWTDHTFNPWIGCTKVAPGCVNCYAEADFDKRRHVAQWGPNGTRIKTSPENWAKPLKWNRDAEKAGVRPRVFCASLSDVFEDWSGPILSHSGSRLVTGRDLTLDDLRRQLFELIDATPHLDWLLLTKRPGNILRMWPAAGTGKDAGADSYLLRDNVWLGTSISDQATAEKATPLLFEARDLAPVLFLSAEPLLGPIDLHKCVGLPRTSRGWHSAAIYECADWIIVGGESGHNARPCHLEHVWSLVVQCKQPGVPVLVKQLGGFCVAENINNFEFPEQIKDEPWGDFAASCRVMLKHKKGGDWDEWPEDLRVRQYPPAT